MTEDEARQRSEADEREVRAMIGDAEFERIQREMQDGLARIDAHYGELNRKRRQEMRYVMAWWGTWTVIFITNLLYWHNDTVSDAAMFAFCMVTAKAIHDSWRCWTGRYPPPPPGM